MKEERKKRSKGLYKIEGGNAAKKPGASGAAGGCLGGEIDSDTVIGGKKVGTSRVVPKGKTIRSSGGQQKLGHVGVRGRLSRGWGKGKQTGGVWARHEK